MTTLLMAIAIAMLLEGLGPLLFPNKWKKLMRKMTEEPTQSLRQVGAVLVGFGAILLFYLY